MTAPAVPFDCHFTSHAYGVGYDATKGTIPNFTPPGGPCPPIPGFHDSQYIPPLDAPK